MKSTLRKSFLVAVWLTVSSLRCDGQNLLLNGSFELPGEIPAGSSLYLTNGDTRLTGWSVGGYGGPITLANGTQGTLDFPAVEGAFQLSFNDGNGASGSWIRQTFDTAIGQDYLVSFYVGRRGPGLGNVSLTVSAYDGNGRPIGSVVAVPPAHGYSMVQHLFFRATTEHATLLIQDTSAATVSVDVCLDTVSVIAFPSDLPTIEIEAYIDGLSQLNISPRGIWWNHLQFERPGRAQDADFRTSVNGYAWYPTWPDNNNRNPGLSDSLAVSAHFPPEAVTVAPDLARGPVTITQQPSAENGFTLVLQFDDTLPEGAAFYRTKLIGASLNILPVLSIQVASVGLSFPAEINRLYQVQYLTDLNSTNWVDLGGPIQGMGTNAVVLDPVLGESRRLYRVVPLP